MSFRCLPWRLAIALCLCFASAALTQDEELQRKINRAIDRGVRQLQRTGGESGEWYGLVQPGMSALAAWTLLESGVKESDPQVQKAAARIRKECLNSTSTYSLALAILFFDRLGDLGDEPLIQALGVRLLAGQGTTGTWPYISKFGDDSDRSWLQRQLDEADKNRKEKTAPAVDKKTLLPEIKKQLARVQPSQGYAEDNSNTQFAMLALWVARRHGLPIEDAIERVHSHFRKSQIAGGAWGYRPGFLEPARVTMTCAGLLGLALGEGIKPKKEGQGDKLKKDPKVKDALALLGRYLKNPEGEKEKLLLEKPGMFNYFLFSLERMAVVYDVKTIGDLDWYTWGAKILVDKQNGDGSWPGDYAIADTCFALLFLKRANVAEDLTLNLNPLAKPREKKKLKKSERERGDDPFDFPPDKDKKKIKIRPKDKQSGCHFPGRLDFLEAKFEIRISKSETDSNIERKKSQKMVSRLPFISAS